MHAILVSNDNVEKIRDRFKTNDLMYMVQLCLQTDSRWYAISEYVSRQGIFLDNVLLPAYMVELGFIIDKDAAAKDWDTVYRLA